VHPTRSRLRLIPVTFSLVWADAYRQDLPWEPPHHFKCNNAMMDLIRDELEAQGVGAYEEGGAATRSISTSSSRTMGSISRGLSAQR
jgi:hypothetical protein